MHSQNICCPERSAALDVLRGPERRRCRRRCHRGGSSWRKLTDAESYNGRQLAYGLDSQWTATPSCHPLAVLRSQQVANRSEHLADAQAMSSRRRHEMQVAIRRRRAAMIEGRPVKANWVRVVFGEDAEADAESLADSRGTDSERPPRAGRDRPGRRRWRTRTRWCLPTVACKSRSTWTRGRLAGRRRSPRRAASQKPTWHVLKLLRAQFCPSGPSHRAPFGTRIFTMELCYSLNDSGAVTGVSVYGELPSTCYASGTVYSRLQRAAHCRNGQNLQRRLQRVLPGSFHLVCGVWGVWAPAPALRRAASRHGAFQRLRVCTVQNPK